MKVDWKVVLPLALVVCVMVLYFVRVKPIEGYEPADAEYGYRGRRSGERKKSWMYDVPPM